MITIYVK